jgi:hypothetical protein
LSRKKRKPTTANPSSIGATVTKDDFDVAQRLHLPAEEIWQLRAWDHGLVPTAVEQDDEEGDVDVPPEEGTLYSTSTIDAYVSAVIELYDIQVSSSLKVFKCLFLYTN